jgi:hypothetical protein
MQTSKQPDDTGEPDSDFLEEYVNAEAVQDLEERQELDQVGRQVLRRRLREHTSESPKLTGGDIDAAWDLADGSDETIGGDAPTPDQDVVDEIGEGAGLTYQDDEPLNYAKVFDRDRHRWELNPASAATADKEGPDQEADDELEELGLLDDEVEKESLSVVDVDDLAEELDDEELDEEELGEDELDEDDVDDEDEDDGEQ